MNKYNQYDVIVVGGGPGGTTVAMNTAREGYKTLIIDKDKFPREKTCGGLVPIKALKELDFSVPSAIIKNEIKSISLYNRQMDCTTYGRDGILGLVLPRVDFDHYLLERAMEYGSQFHPNTKFYELERIDNGIKIFTSNGNYTCKNLVGSDGVFSSVKNYVGYNMLDQYKMGFTLSAYANHKELDQTENFKIFDIPIKYSMGWGIPYEKRVHIGIGGPAFKSNEMMGYFEEYSKTLHGVYGFDKASIKVKGCFLPAGGFKRKIYREGVLLVGDAAGFVDPMVGEGIYYAIRSGKIAAKQITSGGIDKYEELCYKEFNGKLKKSLMCNLLGINKSYTKIKPLREKLCMDYLKTMEN